MAQAFGEARMVGMEGNMVGVVGRQPGSAWLNIQFGHTGATAYAHYARSAGQQIPGLPAHVLDQSGRVSLTWAVLLLGSEAAGEAEADPPQESTYKACVWLLLLLMLHLPVFGWLLCLSNP